MEFLGVFASWFLMELGFTGESHANAPQREAAGSCRRTTGTRGEALLVELDVVLGHAGGREAFLKDLAATGAAERRDPRHESMEMLGVTSKLRLR